MLLADAEKLSPLGRSLVVTTVGNGPEGPEVFTVSEKD
jgi:hypothetical protein